MIVRDDRDRTSFLARLGRTVERHDWSCLAFCLLNNHFHLVVQTPERNLGVGMKWLKAAHAQDFNHRYGRTGHLFGGRFFSEIIRREAHLVSAIVYVILNPVRAGIVTDPAHWPWSSYPATLGLAPAPSFLDVEEVLGLVDPREDVARRMLKRAVDETAMLDHRRQALGSDPWGLTPGSA